MNHLPNRHIGSILLAAMGIALVGCATPPKVGVRPAFEQRQVQRVAVVPFYSVAQFSLTQPQLDRVIAQSERSAVRSLRDSGFKVVEPDLFRQYLDDHEATTSFDDGVLLRNSLAHYFEPAGAATAEPSLEVETIRQLYKQGKLPAEALLFGEVVYHTRTQCRVDPADYTPYARVTESADAPAQAPPCIVTHFQAKLVYAPTGETMWFNRRLLETHFARPPVDGAAHNLTTTVQRALGGPDGLMAFHRAGPSNKSATATEQAEK